MPRAGAPAETTIVAKRSDDRVAGRSAGHAAQDPNVVRVGDRFNDPWLRAMIVSPSAQSYMKTTLLGLPDFRNLGPFMQKPAATVMMTFSENPHLGMTSEKFAGSAVVFIPQSHSTRRDGSAAVVFIPSSGDRWGVAPQVGETRLAAHRFQQTQNRRLASGFIRHSPTRQPLFAT